MRPGLCPPSTLISHPLSRLYLCSRHTYELTCNKRLPARVSVRAVPCLDSPCCPTPWPPAPFQLVQGLADHGLQAQSGPLPVSGNKVLLEHSHADSLLYCLWLHSPTAVKLQSLNFYYLGLFYRKKFSKPWSSLYLLKPQASVEKSLPSGSLSVNSQSQTSPRTTFFSFRASGPGCHYTFINETIAHHLSFSLCRRRRALRCRLSWVVLPRAATRFSLPPRITWGCHFAALFSTK